MGAQSGNAFNIEGSNSDRDRSYRTAFIVITSIFFMWGFITVLNDILIPFLKKMFELVSVDVRPVYLFWCLFHRVGHLFHHIGFLGRSDE